MGETEIHESLMTPNIQNLRGTQQMYHMLTHRSDRHFSTYFDSYTGHHQESCLAKHLSLRITTTLFAILTCCWNQKGFHLEIPLEYLKDPLAVFDLFLSYLSGWRIPVVEMLFIRVHPNLCSSNGILEEVWPCIRGLFRKYMAHMRAGVNLQAAPTLPHLMRQTTNHKPLNCLLHFSTKL